MKYTDRQRIEKIYNNAYKLNEYISEHNISRESVINDFSIQWLVTTPLFNIGEHAYNLSPEFKSKFENIPWSMIAGLRHRLVHDYDGVYWNVIADIVFEEIPALIKQIKAIIDEGAIN